MTFPYLKIFLSSGCSCRYNVEEEGGCDDLDQGDNGWKIIHTDVFRFPPYKSLLCAVLGVGAQFLTLATGNHQHTGLTLRTHELNLTVTAPQNTESQFRNIYKQIRVEFDHL